MKFSRLLLAPALLGLSACGGGGGGSDDEELPPVEVTMLTCEAPERPPSAAGFKTQTPYPDLGRIRSLTMIKQHPAHPNKWFVVEQRGSIVMFDESDPGNLMTWLDYSSAVKDRAAETNGRSLGLEFHPNYPETPEVFVYYTGIENGFLASVVKRVTLDDIDNPVAPVYETIFSLPQRGSFHKGGDIRFGPDGYLYLALGDGGEGGRPRSQQTTNLYGSMLRLDVEGTGAGYAIPPDNPFGANAACTNGLDTGADCAEIWAWGLRNPYRWSFDASNRLWIGDVGNNVMEEIDIVEKGKNYGWGCYEGTLDFSTAQCPEGTPVVFPVYEYPHEDGDGSVTGGRIYTGSIASLQGRYVFADFVSGRIRALTDDGTGNWEAELLIDTPYLIADLARGNDGEIYIADRSDGQIHRLIEATGEGVNTIPTYLQGTSCVELGDPTTVSEELVPYEINAPFWSDGAVKTRYMNIPESTTVDINEIDDWDYPIGTVLMKNFELNNRLIETRLFMRHPDGDWGGYTWEWNRSQTRATRVVGGKVKEVAGQQWLYPSEAQCMVCHNGAAGFSLGPETAQLNRTVLTEESLVDQLAELDNQGFFTEPLPDSAALPKLADYLDENNSLDDRARAWLHTNCAGCHRENGPTPSSMNLLHTVPLADTNSCEISPSADDLGIPNAKLIAVGKPEESVVLSRLTRRDESQMPPLGSYIPDPVGVQLITEWIASLESCN